MIKSRSPRSAALYLHPWLRNWRWFALLSGFLIRVIYAFSLPDEAAYGGWDGKEYYTYAQSLLSLQWDVYPRFFNCIRAPLYPVFLTPFVAASSSLKHIQIAQAAIGTFTAIMVGKIAARWAGPTAGVCALFLALFHPFLIFFPAMIWTETLFIALLWSGIYFLQKFNDARNRLGTVGLAAVTLSMGCLTRPSLQPLLLIATAWVGVVSWRAYGWRISLRMAGGFTAIATALLLPVMIINLYRHGDLSLAPGSAQLVYAQSNSRAYLKTYEARTREEYYQHNDYLHKHFSVEAGTHPDEWQREALEFQLGHPGDWVRLQWYKFKHFWTPWLNPLIFPRSVFLVSVVSATPIFILALVEILRRAPAVDAFFILLLSVAGVGYLVGGFLFHVQVRYRIPFVDVCLIILSSSLLGHAIYKARNLRSRLT